MFYHQRRVDYGHQFYGVPCFVSWMFSFVVASQNLNIISLEIGDMASGFRCQHLNRVLVPQELWLELV